MEKHHEHAMLLRLEKIRDHGFAEITREELAAWFNRERLTSFVWEQIETRWKEEVCGGIDYPLAVLPRPIGAQMPGVYVFVNVHQFFDFRRWHQGEFEKNGRFAFVYGRSFFKEYPDFESFALGDPETENDG